MRTYTKILLAVVAAALVAVASVPSESIVSFSGRAASVLSSVVLSPVPFLGNLLSRASQSGTLEELRSENEALRAELLLALKSAQSVHTEGHEYRLAKVFSSYPFNNRGLIAVNAGARDGVHVGMPVTVGAGIFVGQIAEVFDSYATVRTVFDVDWQIPVKVGNDQSDALLVGGRDPHLAMIIREGTLSVGEVVYAALKDFPYGLTVGDVGTIRTKSGQALEEAELLLPYNPATLTEVSIMVR
jgi:cell shape-determining protein MreC